MLFFCRYRQKVVLLQVILRNILANAMSYKIKRLYIALIVSMQLISLISCMDSGYRLSFPEIDDLADEYPAQAKVFLSRADSNDNKGYYKLLAAKIDYQLNGSTIKDDNIDDAIHIFTAENNEPFLARSLYYKGALTLNNYRDTTQALGYLKKACYYATSMREKEKMDMLDLLCRLTHQDTYPLQMEDEARRAHDIPHRAWAMLYRAINNQDQTLPDKAFETANHIAENKDSTLGPMYYYYFVSLLDNGHVPDSILTKYIQKADSNHGIKHNNDIDYYRWLWHSKATYGEKKLQEEVKLSMDLRTIGKQYTFSIGYDGFLPLYLLALHYGDTLTAQTIAHELRQEAPLLAKDNNYEKAKEVELMYQGGNTSYRYALTKIYILISVIVVLIILLLMAYLYISRMRQARHTITALHASLHQLKDVENASLSQRCEALNRDITSQLRKLRRRDKDIEAYKTQINELTDISQGLVYYSMAVQNQNISQIGKQGIRQLLASFKMIDEKYYERLENYDLNPSQSLFCILYHIGKTDEEVMQILQYSLSNVRVRKSRIKGDAEVDSFDEIIR